MSSSSSRGSSWIFKWLSVAALVLVAALAFAACGDDDDGGDGDGDGGSLLEKARADGSLTVGIANEAPYGFEDESGAVTGEAPEVAKEVLSRLGIPAIDAVVVDFGALIPGLNAGQFDMIAAGMFITPERAQQTSFSDPDYCATQAFAVAAGNPKGISDFASIADNDDAVVGVLTGAFEEGYAEDAGIPGDRIEVYDTTPNVFEALQDGRIDAVALTSITVNWQILQLGDSSIEGTEGFVPVIDGEEKFGCGGYGFRFEDQDFRDAFNDELKSMKENDEILPIVEQFGFAASDVSQAKDVTVQDLAGE